MHVAKPLAAALMFIGLMATPSLAADPTGTWQSTTGESRYHVAYCGDGGEVCAKLTWLREDARTAENLAYLNRNVVQAVPAGENTWKGQVAYEGDVFAGNLMLVSNDAMKIRGCKGMFCQSMSFERL